MDRHAIDGGVRTPGAGRRLRMHDIDALVGDQACQAARVLENPQRIDRMMGHWQPLAAEGAELSDQRAFITRNDRAGA